ncbi:efflux RND transporter periplasmic adaptor subunit [Marinobacter sp. S0848L]|uniref:efflux RND transporter periplasmic adaptor subunit n=1 Tax=Marinobacter sp. S0848L TaxID=2926423 RepID=UPI001FF2271B|nr:efflux RND transporter periplasmic adaptor subunit [Marinobacter sp. S0848L]MCK0106756.1 efflux RND transporter periplasmic adaptor subunit [Marinobacter sp. S0848L]
MWKQWLVGMAVVAIVLVGVGVYLNQQPVAEGQDQQAKPTTVNIGQPQMRQIRDQISAVANLRPVDSVELMTEASGRVVELNLKPGQPVQQGEVLLRLDDRQARADLAVLKARLSDARRQYDRARSLRANNSVSQSQVDELQTSVAVAAAELEAAKVRLENHRIEAPFAGVIGLSNISLGAFLQAGTSITTLDSSGQLELNFSVPERFVGQVKVGQPVSAVSPAFPDQLFEGQLVELATRISELSRTLAVRALIDNPDGQLRPGQFMSASLTLQQREALVVPEQAVMVRGDEKYVFLAEDGLARRVPVQIGNRMPGWVEIKEGLSLEDSVVVTGQDRLSSGNRIRELESDRSIPENRFESVRES